MLRREESIIGLYFTSGKRRYQKVRKKFRDPLDFFESARAYGITEPAPKRCFIDNKKCPHSNLGCLIEYKDPSMYPHWICEKIRPFYKKRERIRKSFLWRLFYKIQDFIFPRSFTPWNLSLCLGVSFRGLGAPPHSSSLEYIRND